MRNLGPCRFCGRPSAGEAHIVVFNHLRRSWLLCNAHAACMAVERITVTVRCMDTQWAVTLEGPCGDEAA